MHSLPHHDWRPQWHEEVVPVAHQLQASADKMSQDLSALEKALAMLRVKVRTLLYDASDLLAPEAPAGCVINDFKAPFETVTTLKMQLEVLIGSMLDGHLDTQVPAFGPDEASHVTMNFGPLNRNGGERRLCVAMTHARSEMVVFLAPECIDLSRTLARPVADLKHLLESAKCDAFALGAAVHGFVGNFDSPFKIAVARDLHKKGWILHPQMGASAYPIYMGILHPDKSGVYLASIEGDGDMHHSSSLCSRAGQGTPGRIRRGGLEALGVWSTDW